MSLPHLKDKPGPHWLINTKQYLTNLVSVGIFGYEQSITYSCQYDSSIMKVSSQYGSDSFLSVCYHHSTDSGDFHETFDA
jgi:hypothetical protein